MATPTAFISYSHDSQDHKKWVLDLATRLRNTGIDAIIDQWELKPGDDLPHFMESHLANSDYVIMICSERYVKKANSGIGGVGYEKMIVTADLLRNIDSNKVIPIIKQSGTHDVPTFLKSKLFLDFSLEDDFEFSFDELIRALHNSPLYKKPPVGNNPFVHIENIRPEKTGDLLKAFMQILVDDYEKGQNFSNMKDVESKMHISRIMFEIITEDVVKKKLGVFILTTSLVYSNEKKGSINRKFSLTEKGKFYAIEHKLITT